MPWVEVECPNEDCPGRQVAHPTSCVCNGTGRVRREDGAGWTDCEAEPESTPLRWRAWWWNHTLAKAGGWHKSIFCRECGTEGEDAAA